MKKSALFFLVILSLFSLGQLKHSLTDGFSVKKVATTLLDETRVSPPLDYGFFLNQPFHYLGKGGQAYVFESLDRQFVLKLIRFDLFKPPFWASFYRNNQNSRWGRKAKRYHEAIKSYTIALEELKESTGVIAVHLTTTHTLHCNLDLIDAAGQHYSLPADTTPFVLQKKATLFGEVIEEALRKQELERVDRYLSSYVELIGNRLKKGVYVKDHNFWARNYGVVEGNKLLEIDVGSYCEDRSFSDREFLKRDTLAHIAGLRAYILTKAPECISHFDQEISDLFFELDQCDM